MRHVSEAENFMTSLWSIPAMQQTQNAKSKTSAGSRPEDKGGGDHPDPEISETSVWSKNKGGRVPGLLP